MHLMTQQNLINAFGGESQAHMRYLHFAVRADIEKFPETARLLRAIAHAEYIHAGDHYALLKDLDGGYVANSMAAFGPGNTLKNLGLSIAGETFEITEMYPTYIETARFQQEPGAVRSFEWAYATEKEHKILFERAQKSVAESKDVAIGAIQVCNVCGFTLEGDAPDVCPVCGARKEKFTGF